MDEFGLRRNGYTKMPNGMWWQRFEFPNDRTEEDHRNSYAETVIRRSDGSIFRVLRGKKQLSQPSLRK